MRLKNSHNISAEIGLRPQQRFRNPRNYPLTSPLDADYCSFKVPASTKPGVYFWRVDGRIMYVGRAKSLRGRLSDQYGRVSPRHPFKGGQLQKCRINALICAALAEGRSVTVEWEETPEYVKLEEELLGKLKPVWNLKLASERGCLEEPLI